MGCVIPPYQLDARDQDEISARLAELMAEKFPSKQAKDLDFRPLRPEELNTALTVTTRRYDTTMGAVPTRILNAAADPIVRAGSFYVIFGWIVIDDPAGANPFGIQAIGQIASDGTVLNEVNLQFVNGLINHCLYTRDQIVELGESASFSIMIIGAPNLARFIAYPLGYRIAVRSQLNKN